MTLAEHHAQLKTEGKWEEYVARREERDEAVRRNAEQMRVAEAPIVQALRAAGANVSSVWDLVNSKAAYPELVPVLLDHLQRSYPDAVREGIARALAVPGSRSAWSLLVRMYREEEETRAKNGLAVAIAAVAADEAISDLIELARDSRHGASRLLLLGALERAKDPRARQTLMELGTDSDLKTEVQVILRRLKRRNRSRR